MPCTADLAQRQHANATEYIVSGAVRNVRPHQTRLELLILLRFKTVIIHRNAKGYLP